MRIFKLLFLLCLSISRVSAEPDSQRVAIFAGGCFWCMEKPFDNLDGIVETTTGYTGGKTVDPSYTQVSAGKTGHFEAVKVIYDPNRTTYRQLLEVFWRNVDPLDPHGQFCDRGPQYRSAIFYLNDEQRDLAATSRKVLESQQRFSGKIATLILPAGRFYRAEEYHQNYYQTHPLKYRFYRLTCGRDRRLRQLWDGRQ